MNGRNELIHLMADLTRIKEDVQRLERWPLAEKRTGERLAQLREWQARVERRIEELEAGP